MIWVKLFRFAILWCDCFLLTDWCSGQDSSPVLHFIRQILGPPSAALTRTERLAKVIHSNDFFQRVKEFRGRRICVFCNLQRKTETLWSERVHRVCQKIRRCTGIIYVMPDIIVERPQLLISSVRYTQE